MKTFTWSGLVAAGLALSVGGVQAGVMVSPFANQQPQQQQFTAPGQQVTAPAQNVPAPRPTVVTQPTFVGKSFGPQPRPAPSAMVPRTGPSKIIAPPANRTLVLPQFTGGQSFLSGTGDWRNSGGSGRFGRDRDFDHDGFHRRGNNCSFIIVYVNNAPLWYPVYTAYPYYYDTPPPVAYDNGYYGAGAGYTAPADMSISDGGAVEAAPSYGDLGTGWGQDLRRDIATWDQFVVYLKAYIITALPAAQADFREGFIASYGLNGAAAYDKAIKQASGSTQQPPKVTSIQLSY